MSRSIVWFKTDLRLEDNETLLEAIRQSTEVIPVYCFDRTHFITTNYGLKKTGVFRANFLLQCLADLDNQLQSLGSALVVLKGDPAVELIELAKEYSVTKVFAQQEIGPEEIALQKRVETALNKIHCGFMTFQTGSLFREKDLPFPIRDTPDIFTNFRKRIEKEATVPGVMPPPKSITSPKIEPSVWPSLPDLSLEEVKSDGRSALAFRGGETEAWKRLRHYFFETQSLSRYKETRNGLIGADYSSKFSPWLALGCLSARSIYAQIKKYESEVHANDSTYWLFFELLWREYFRWMMIKYGSNFFMKRGIQDKKEIGSPFDEEVFQKWINGQTGVDFVDANMIELKLTGFMSNRGRQNVASYFCHNLKQDWRYGAAYFEQQLIDYDVSSNWRNWAYVAGVGNDPRRDRVFNIEKQASDYDRNKTYRHLWLNQS